MSQHIKTWQRGIGWIIWIVGLLAAFGVYIKFGGSAP
jgi:hypothetical protein